MTTPFLRNSAPSEIRRRTVLHGAAWSVPAFVLISATPAHASSGAQLSITQSPDETLACEPTGGPVVAHLDDASNVGRLVQFSLPDGWRWSRGSGAYVTDANGDATVPAGDIIVGTSVGTVTATSSALSAAVDLGVAAPGELRADQSDTSFPAGANSGVLRVVSAAAGVVVVRKNGDIWSRYAAESWTQAGTGGATGAQQATFIDGTSTRAPLWIKSGELQMGSSAAPTMYYVKNADFVGVHSAGPRALAVKSSDDVLYGWEESGGQWAGVDNGVDAGLQKFACFHSSSRSDFFYLKKGVLYSASGGAVDMGAGQNSGIVRVSSLRAPDDDGSVLIVVTSNGTAWSWTEKGGWAQRATGAQTAAEQAVPWVIGSAGGQAETIREGVLEIGGQAGNVRFSAQTTNSDFYRVSANRGFALASKRKSGQLFVDSGSGYDEAASGVAIGYDQSAVQVWNNSGTNYRTFWISPASC